MSSSEYYLFSIRNKLRKPCIFTTVISFLSIDATNSDRKGKILNDAWVRPNAVVKKVVVADQPRLAIFALVPISKSQEIRFDYGDKTAPWRKKSGKVGAVVVCKCFCSFVLHYKVMIFS